MAQMFGTEFGQFPRFRQRQQMLTDEAIRQQQAAEQARTAAQLQLERGQAQIAREGQQRELENLQNRLLQRHLGDLSSKLGVSPGTTLSPADQQALNQTAAQQASRDIAEMLTTNPLLGMTTANTAYQKAQAYAPLAGTIGGLEGQEDVAKAMAGQATASADRLAAQERGDTGVKADRASNLSRAKISRLAGSTATAAEPYVNESAYLDAMQHQGQTGATINTLNALAPYNAPLARSGAQQKIAESNLATGVANATDPTQLGRAVNAQAAGEEAVGGAISQSPNISPKIYHEPPMGLVYGNMFGGQAGGQTPGNAAGGAATMGGNPYDPNALNPQLQAYRNLLRQRTGMPAPNLSGLRTPMSGAPQDGIYGVNVPGMMPPPWRALPENRFDNPVYNINQ